MTAEIKIPDQDKREAKSQGETLVKNGVKSIEAVDAGQQPRPTATPSIGETQEIGQNR